MTRTVAEVLLKTLADWGVKNIYGVSGDAVLPLMDALGRQDRISFFSTATEQGAAFMACGEARTTGRPGVCLSTEGPGALNLVNGVADAYTDGIPMLVITGQVAAGKLHTGAKQYFDQQQLFAPVTGLTSLVTRPESVVDTLRTAMEKASGDGTPCHLSIPKDIFSSPCPEGEVPPPGRPLPPGVSGDIEGVLKILAGCRRPLIVAGRAALPVKDAVLRLAGIIGAGIIPSQGARGIYPGREEKVLAGLGEAHVPPVLKRSDCVLLIGSSPYEHGFIPPGAAVVQIETAPQKLSRRLRPVPLTGDVALIMERLLEGMAGAAADPGWQDEIKKCHHDHLKMIGAEAGLAERPASPRKIVSLLNELIPEDAVVAIDTGEFMHWFDRGFIAREQRVIISEYWRCMGAGLPMGLGARAASPGKKVVVLAGEGGFIMTMQEILTAVRYSLPVTVIVFNNGSYLLEEHRMGAGGMKPFGVDVLPPDLSAFASSCGAAGFKAEDPGGLGETLARAMALDVPAVVDIATSRERPLFI